MTKLPVITFCILLVVLLASPAMANDYKACRNAAASIDPKIMDCQDAELTRQDARLNTEYRKLLAQLKGTPATVNKLRESERAWIAFRDANCGLIPAVFGNGSADRINYTDCLIDMTAARVADLNTWTSSRTVERQ